MKVKLSFVLLSVVVICFLIAPAWAGALPPEDIPLDSGLNPETISAISAGSHHTCEVWSDGTVICWGQNYSGQSTPPPDIFTAVSAGGHHNCGVKTDGTVACWGNNYYGQSTPPLDTFTEVSAGGYHTCGVKTDGTIACWGRNQAGQSTPPTGTFIQVSAGLWHTCGVKTDRIVACWGRNNDGESRPPSGTFIQVSAGGYHTCGVKTDGTIACWGDNYYGQSTPPLDTFTEVSAGYYHTCGVKTDGTVDCWGRNNNGESRPPSGTFIQVSAGGYHTCGVKTDGTIACWGSNSYGQAPVIRFEPMTLSWGTPGYPYLQTLTAGGGLSPYTYSVISGNLPPGLTLATSGILSGIPTASGSYTFTVSALDSRNMSGTQVYTPTITRVSLGALTPASLTSPAGIPESFKAVYSATAGYMNLKTARFRIGSSRNGIYVLYTTSTNTLSLYNDARTGTTICTAGGGGTLSNSQGTVNCAASTASGSGNNLTLTFNITPKAAFASTTAKNVYMNADDNGGRSAGWTQKGTWTIQDVTPPTLGTLYPASLTSSAGVAESLTAVYRDIDGYANLKSVRFRVGSSANGIYVRYTRSTNTLSLYSDAGTATTSCTARVAGTLSNSQGIINCAKSAATGSGNNLILTLNITPKAAFASTTAKNLYMYATDNGGLSVGWTKKGTWTITP